MSALRLWFMASQILLASGALAVVLGTVGVLRFGAAKEHVAVAEAVSRKPAVSVATPAPDVAQIAQIAALKAENEDLHSRLAAAQKDLKAAATVQSHPQASAPPGPRALTEAQKSRLLAALKAIPGPPNLNVLTLSDPEAAAYGDQFIKLIDQAGYRGQARNIGAPSPLPRGVHLTLNPSNTRGAAIKYALEAVGVPLTVSSGDTGAFDIQITIGVRP